MTSSSISLTSETFTDVELLPNNTVDCITVNLGCNGGWLDRTLDGVLNNGGGMNPDSSYPYQASQGSCRYNPSNIAATIKAYEVVRSGDESDLLAKVGM